jgi:hypothetical protein
LLALSLFKLQLHPMITRILLQLCLAPNSPFKLADTAFAVADLGRGHDFNGDLPDEAL